MKFLHSRKVPYMHLWFFGNPIWPPLQDKGLTKTIYEKRENKLSEKIEILLNL
jgi:hypothetical protein